MKSQAEWRRKSAKLRLSSTRVLRRLRIRGNREKKIGMYFYDIVRIAREEADAPDLQMRMQGIVLTGAFLRLTPYAKEAEMTNEQVDASVEKAIRKNFGKHGEQVIKNNMKCIKRGSDEMKEIPQDVIFAK